MSAGRLKSNLHQNKGNYVAHYRHRLFIRYRDVCRRAAQRGKGADLSGVLVGAAQPVCVLGGENTAAQPAAAGAGKASKRCRIKLFTRLDILYNAAAFIF